MNEKTKKTGRSRRKLKLKSREALVGYLFVSPWIIGALIFVIVPLFRSFYYDLSNVKITPTGRQVTPAGITNFTQILQEDPDFPRLLGGYLATTIVAVPVIVVFALLIAMLLNGNIKGKGLFRLIFFLPVIIASGPVMTQLVDQGAGTVPAMDVSGVIMNLEIMPSFLAEIISELFNSMVMYLWYSGVQILIFLSAIQKIDSSLYEAAEIDGGSSWQCFWKITLPTIMPMILLNAIYTVIFLSNNEQNEIIEFIKNAMFGTSGSQGYGYASAMAWLYAVVMTLLVALCALLLTSRGDAYQKKVKQVRKEEKKQAKLMRKLERKDRKYAKAESRTKHHKS